MNPGLFSGLVRSPAYYQELHLGIPSDTAETYENPLTILGDFNDYFGPSTQNLNSGAGASTDYVFTNDLGNSGSFLNDELTYGDLGVNSSTNANPFNTLFGPSDMYLFISGALQNMNIANGASGTAIKFGIGGLLAANEVARLTANYQRFNNVLDVNNAVTVTSNAGTCSDSYRLNTFTNSSAATMTITLQVSTPTPVDGQMMVVRIYDFSAVAEGITWVNTENSTITPPATSNGSTTLPLTVGFQYNTKTSKWRCLASA